MLQPQLSRSRKLGGREPVATVQAHRIELEMVKQIDAKPQHGTGVAASLRPVAPVGADQA
jgi:hypothetical protein